eukprot:m.286198 g.286198  ORF g.286198 m.286198 type:complete len:316 (-) comp19437_c2_seq2:975-1922(-)
MNRDAQLKQARALLAEAQKCEKTTMFKWKPDWEAASVAYDKAAMQFKLGKDFIKAREVYMMACNAHQQYNALFHAAKALEGAAACAKESKAHADSAELTIRASHLYRQNGTPEAACTALEKAAKASVACGNEEQAAEMYFDIYDMRHDEDKPRQCKDPLAKALQICLRTKKYERAAEMSAHQVSLMHEIGNADLYAKSVLTAVTIALLRGDYVAAEKLYESCVQRNPAVAHSDEVKLADQVLTAFDEGDDERLQELTKDRLYTFIDNEVRHDHSLGAHIIHKLTDRDRLRVVSDAVHDAVHDVVPPPRSHLGRLH